MHISNIFAHIHALMHLLTKSRHKIKCLHSPFAAAATMTRHPYYTYSSKSKIMAEYEADNASVHESIVQVQGEMNLFRGNMETILEILQS